MAWRENAHGEGAGILTFKDEDICDTLTHASRRKNAGAMRQHPRPVLLRFLRAWSSTPSHHPRRCTTFELGPILQGVAGAAGVIGGLFRGARRPGRISDRIGRKTTLVMGRAFPPVRGPPLGPISPLLGGFRLPILAP